MKSRSLSLLLAICCSFFIVTSSHAASLQINGSYVGTLYYIKATPIGTGACYTQEQYPTGSFTMIKVKANGSKVTGKYWNGAKYVSMTGSRTRKGFDMKLKYKSGGYTFDYVIKASSITTTSGYINLAGKTNYTKTHGCKYIFAGTVAHGK